MEWQSLPARAGDALDAVRDHPGLRPGEDPPDVSGAWASGCPDPGMGAFRRPGVRALELRGAFRRPGVRALEFGRCV